MFLFFVSWIFSKIVCVLRRKLNSVIIIGIPVAGVFTHFSGDGGLKNPPLFWNLMDIQYSVSGSKCVI